MSLHSIPLGLTTDTPFTDHPSAAVDYLAAQDRGRRSRSPTTAAGSAYEVPGFRPNANVLAGVPSLDGYDGGVQITKRWATALQRFTADPPTELPFRNSLQLPVTPESMARLGVRYIMLDKARDPEVFIPGWIGPVAEDATVGVWENPAWIGDAVAWPTVIVDDVRRAGRPAASRRRPLRRHRDRRPVRHRPAVHRSDGGRLCARSGSRSTAAAPNTSWCATDLDGPAS